tara:strand:- start:1131 stop:1331 length:201 start_codon:yes stop_codon:yes gene_type:complete
VAFYYFPHPQPPEVFLMIEKRDILFVANELDEGGFSLARDMCVDNTGNDFCVCMIAFRFPLKHAWD